METTALRFHEFGLPQNVLRLDRLPCRAPGPGEARVRMLAAPINPSDLGSIAGSYGELPALPATPGREGVAEVVEIGPDVAGIQPGQRVLFPDGFGSWQTDSIVPAASLLPVPPGAPVEQAAMAAINPPTAWLLLESFVTLRRGDWIIQNAANSAVGHYVIQLCRERGIRTINTVRRTGWIERLQREGADAVFLEGEDLPARVREVTGGNLPALALNSVGGQSAISLVKSLRDGGTLVTFGGMTGEPVRFPTRYLIFNDLRLVGFWLHRWKLSRPETAKRELMDRVLGAIARGVLRAPVEATFPLEAFKEAIERASSPGREGKVLFGAEP